jgi:hypothetical protein
MRELVLLTLVLVGVLAPTLSSDARASDDRDCENDASAASCNNDTDARGV